MSWLCHDVPDNALGGMKKKISNAANAPEINAHREEDNDSPAIFTFALIKHQDSHSLVSGSVNWRRAMGFSFERDLAP